MKQCEVLVIGGGPAGLSAAISAAKAGAQVTVNSAEYVQQQIAQARAQDKDNPHPKIAAQFSGKTDASGVVVFSGVGAGFWLAHVGHKSPYPESARCDTQSLAATLTFNRR